MLKLFPFVIVLGVLSWGVLKITAKPSPYAVLVSSFTALSSDTVSEYDDETLSQLAKLQKEDFFEGKVVGVWSGQQGIEAHGEVFSLWLAANYLLSPSGRCSITETLKDAGECDYVLFPWESYQLKEAGYRLIHDENWLYIYEKEQAK